jgi:hypothetical protein
MDHISEHIVFKISSPRPPNCGQHTVWTPHYQIPQIRLCWGRMVEDTRMTYSRSEYNLIILSHIVLAKFSIAF